MPFTANLTGTTQVDNSVKVSYETDFIVEFTQNDVVGAFAEYAIEIDAKSISFPKYAALAAATTPLTETEDVTSTAMSDSEILLTPAEHGLSITRTSLADLQTGGRVTRGAMALVAQNMARTRNNLGSLALEASTNVQWAGGGSNDDSVGPTDVMNRAAINKAFNKLRRNNVPFHSAGMYIAFAHDDVIADVRNDTSAGSWIDVNKYNNEIPVLNNEVGMFGGFRWVTNNDATITADSGSGSPSTVDIYDTCFLGRWGLGLAESKVPQIVISGPYDKLNRFVNIGWYGVFKFLIIQSQSVVKVRSASSYQV